MEANIRVDQQTSLHIYIYIYNRDRHTDRHLDFILIYHLNMNKKTVKEN